MNPDFSVFLKPRVDAGFKGAVIVYINGSVLVENDKRGTALHGHTGEWPYRYAISVAVKNHRKAVNKVLRKCGEFGVAVELESLVGEITTGDGGNPYTLYPAKILPLKAKAP